jgi:Flp pilus assembly protein TadG
MMSRQTPVSKRTAVRQAIRRFVVGEDAIAGAALVEFTIFAPLLVVMSIYTMDFGLYLFRNIEVQNAAQAGAQWAIANRGYNSSGIATAAQNATNYTAVTVSSNKFCGCSVDSSGNLVVTTITPSACTPNSTCNTTGLVGTYLNVTATHTAYQSYVPFGLVPSTYDLTGTSTVRIQ